MVTLLTVPRTRKMRSVGDVAGMDPDTAGAAVSMAITAGWMCLISRSIAGNQIGNPLCCFDALFRGGDQRHTYLPLTRVGVVYCA